MSAPTTSAAAAIQDEQVGFGEAVEAALGRRTLSQLRFILDSFHEELTAELPALAAQLSALLATAPGQAGAALTALLATAPASLHPKLRTMRTMHLYIAARERRTLPLSTNPTA